MADSQPCASVAERARLEDSVGKARSALSVLGEADDSEAAKALKHRLEAEQAALDRLKKKAPSPELECSALEGAKAAYLQQMQAKRDRAAACAAKAAERRAERRSFLAGLLTQLQALDAAVVTLEAEHTGAHAERAQQRQAAELEVVALFDVKIAAARAAAASAVTAVQPQLPSQRTGPPGGGAAPGTSGSALAPPTAAGISPELAELERRRALLDQQLQAARERLAVVEAMDARDADFARVADTASLDALPTVQVPTGARLAECGRWYNILHQWMQAGACVPFTFADLQSDQCTVPEVLVTAQLLLGPLWVLWYPGPDVVEPSAVIPRQAACFLHQALDRLKCSYEQREECRAAVASSYAAITADHKKRRAAGLAASAVS